MRNSGYALMLLLYATALASPLLARFVCAGGPVAGAGVARSTCLLADCGSGPGVICRTVF